MNKTTAEIIILMIENEMRFSLNELYEIYKNISSYNLYITKKMFEDDYSMVFQALYHIHKIKMSEFNISLCTINVLNYKKQFAKWYDNDIFKVCHQIREIQCQK